jgi:hypothetical protein
MLPVLYVNLGINTNNNFDNMITKKSTLNTSCISNKVKTNFDYSTTYETKDNVLKILCFNSHFSPNSTTSNDGYAIVEGKIYASLVYETSENDEIKIKQITDTFNVKTDVEMENLSAGSTLDLSFKVDKSYDNISTDLDEGNSVITVVNKINVCGVAFKDVSIDVVEDLYSTDNEVELNYANREYIAKTNNKTCVENVLSEISLSKDEAAIDEIVSNLNANAEITNTYIKDNFVFIEGVVSSYLVYIDENKEFCQKQIEIPFVVNTKIEEEKLCTNHTSVSVLNCKVKVKRGIIIEIEYDLCFDLCEYVTENKEIVDNLTIGKTIDFSNYDYQIYIAKPNESIWQLSKRIKVYPDELSKLNHNLPSTFVGGEKVIIKR